MNQTKMLEWIDYSSFDPEHGGPTPHYRFSVNGSKLKAIVTDDTEEDDPPSSPQTKEEALTYLKDRLEELQKEAAEVEAFIAMVGTTTEYEYEPNNNDE